MDESRTPLRHYILNTSFHGYRYIGEKDRHWTERLFWVFCCTMGWVATGLLMLSAWDDFQNNAISFVVETSYLEWDTQFPSVAVCETDNQDRIAELTDNLYGVSHDYNLDEIVKELVYFHGTSFYTLQICGPEADSPDENCFKKNFSDFPQEVAGNCDKIFRSCKWNEEDFPCCRFFGRIDAELGRCYAINSKQTIEKMPPYAMISNRTSGSGRLMLEINGVANVYVFGEQDVPSFATLAADVLPVTPNIHYRRRLTIREIENQPEVKDVSVRQRKCRFDDESEGLNVYPYYSYSSCCVQCRKDAQLQTCACTHHLMPNTPPEMQCNISGLYCLDKHYDELSVLKPSWGSHSGLTCDCLPSCTEIELSVVKEDKFGISGNHAIVELALENLPSERFKRNVVRGKLDLVVSMGGSTALFLGASILSFVEIFYYFFVRPVDNKIMK